jgi:hypothetical protein
MPSSEDFTKFLEQIHIARIRSRTAEAVAEAEAATERVRLAYLAFAAEAQSSMGNRRLVISNGGHFALAPAWSEEGDRIVIVRDCHCPLVVRPCPGDLCNFTIVGSAYVHGVMFGEAVSNSTDWQNIALV